MVMDANTANKRHGYLYKTLRIEIFPTSNPNFSFIFSLYFFTFIDSAGFW